MPFQSHQLHFVLIPLMCPGHLIPTVDMARLLAEHGATVTIISTPLNTVRFNKIIQRDVECGLPIRILQLRFPCTEAGLPKGCENLDSLPSRELSKNFFIEASMLQQPIEEFLEGTQPKPSCIISDRHLTWTIKITRKYEIPRLVFDGTSCFSIMCSHNIQISKIHEKVSYLEPFVVPGLPDRIELTRAQLPSYLNPSSAKLKGLHEEMEEADLASYGLLVNSFEELEQKYINEYQKAKGDKVWCIGPVSLCNREKLDKAQRGNKASIDGGQCLKWLDSWSPSSVVYVCLGTLSCLAPLQLAELGLALEASNRPFIWVIREGYKSNEFEEWISKEGFEDRIKGRGMLIRGWAPQLLILSHQAIGGFLTHCGWNSVLEAVSVGVPMITWPFLSDQFYNEKFVVNVLRIGESVGASVAMKWGEEDKYGVMVKREEIKKALDMVMDEGEEGRERRKRARELGEMANKSLQEWGSSYLNIRLLIKDIIMQQVTREETKA